MVMENKRVCTSILNVPSRIYTKKETRTEKSPSTAQTHISIPSIQASTNLPPSLRIFERQKKNRSHINAAKARQDIKNSWRLSARNEYG